MSDAPGRRVVAAPDKFRGTATAAEVAAAVARAATRSHWECDEAPVADGGEGTLEVLGGAVRVTTVRGPLGKPVRAEWRVRDDGTAVVEMARASGLLLAGGAEGNDPIAATTHGTGEVINAALESGARRVIVAVGGSATTDGGLGAITALGGRKLRGVDVIVACDVTTRFVDAAEIFAPQKGATPAQVALLRRRLERLAEIYVEDHGIDVRDIEGSGAAGGLAGGLAALGARLVPGFDVVADAIDLDDRVAPADLVVTGEGFLDGQSFEGKAVGGVVEVARAAGVPALVIAGDVYRDELPADPFGGADAVIVSLVERFGKDRAMAETTACIEEVVADHLNAARGVPRSAR
ncbi:MAG: Glycerate kinase [Acidimicrobiales bacterium]|jgi:glycerate kinase|nr:Glycerate kinase [Acidimicrobiales bacterium]